jgi:hypothetical protein
MSRASAAPTPRPEGGGASHRALGASCRFRQRASDALPQRRERELQSGARRRPANPPANPGEKIISGPAKANRTTCRAITAVQLAAETTSSLAR